METDGHHNPCEGKWRASVGASGASVGPIFLPFLFAVLGVFFVEQPTWGV